MAQPDLPPSCRLGPCREPARPRRRGQSRPALRPLRPDVRPAALPRRCPRQGWPTWPRPWSSRTPARRSPKREPADENDRIPAGYTYFGAIRRPRHQLRPDAAGRASRWTATRWSISARRRSTSTASMAAARQTSPTCTNATGCGCASGRRPTRRCWHRSQTKARHPAAGRRHGDPRRQAERREQDRQPVARRLHRLPQQGRPGRRAAGQLRRRPLDARGASFAAAASIVRWHYQWVVVHDFLQRICEPGMVEEVLNPGGTPRLQHYLKTEAKYPYMPLECLRRRLPLRPFHGAAELFAEQGGAGAEGGRRPRPRSASRPSAATRAGPRT